MKFKITLVLATLMSLMAFTAGNVNAQTAAPAAPTGTSAANGSETGQVIVSWNASPGAAFYRIGWVARPDYEATVAAGRDWLEAFHFLDAANTGQTQWTLTRLSPGVEYYFIVASNDNRNGVPQYGNWSNLLALTPASQAVQPVGNPLAAPTNFTAVAKHDSDGDSIVQLSWSTMAGVNEYRVCWKAQSGAVWTCGWDNDPRHESTLRNLDPGVAYEFAARAASGRENPRGSDPTYSDWVFANATVLASSHGCPDDAICDDLSNTVRANLWLRLWEEQDYSGDYHIEVSAGPAFDVDSYRLEVIVRSGRYSADYCNTSDLFSDEGYTQMGCTPLEARLSEITGVSANAEMYTDGALRCARHSRSTDEELLYACVFRN